MAINIFYDNNTFVASTGTVRQWRIQFTIEKDGQTIVVNELFPDYLQTLVTQGYITQDELKTKLFELVDWAARKRLEI